MHGQEHVRVTSHERVTKLSMIFAWNLWDLAGVFFHFGSPSCEVILHGGALLPDGRQSCKSKLLRRRIIAETSRIWYDRFQGLLDRCDHVPQHGERFHAAETHISHEPAQVFRNSLPTKDLPQWELRQLVRGVHGAIHHD